MKPTVEGIMYPLNAKSALLSSGLASHTGPILPSNASSYWPAVWQVPHASWQRCKSVLDQTFSAISAFTAPCGKPSIIFLLAPLHLGSVDFSNETLVYAPQDSVLKGSDWMVQVAVPDKLRPLVRLDSDLVTEECSLEVCAPYLDVLFPGQPVCYLLATATTPNPSVSASFATGRILDPSAPLHVGPISPSAGGVLGRIVEIIGTFPRPLILVSNNAERQCAGMWMQALGE